MRKRFLVTISVLLVVGILVSAIYWWAHSFSFGIPHPAGWVDVYWNQWYHWVKISLLVLAALWILYLLIWIIGKKREGKIYRNMDMGRAMNVSPRGVDWIAPEHGAAYRSEDKPQGEPIEFIDPSEVIRPRSVFEEGQDFLSKYKYHENEHAKGETASTKEGRMKNYENDARVFLMKQEVSRLVEEGRLTPNEAIKLRQDIENSIDRPETYLDTKHFLQAIRHRPTK